MLEINISKKEIKNKKYNLHNINFEESFSALGWRE